MKTSIQNYSRRVNLGRLHYDMGATIDNLQRNAYTYKCILDSDGNFIKDSWKYNKSNIQFQLYLTEKPRYSNMDNLSEYASSYIFQVSHIMAIVALNSIYVNSNNPHVYKLYCEAVKLAQDMEVNYSLETVIKKHDKKRGKHGKMIECIPYYTQEIISEFEDVADIQDDLNAQDIVDHIYLVLLALIRTGNISNYSHVWMNASTVWQAVNSYVRNERRQAEQAQMMIDEKALIDNMGTCDKRQAVQIWKEDIVPVIHTALVSSSKHIDNEKADMIILVYSMSLNGYTQDEIAERLKKRGLSVSRDMVKRNIALMKKYILNSSEICDYIKEAING